MPAWSFQPGLCCDASSTIPTAQSFVDCFLQPGHFIVLLSAAAFSEETKRSSPPSPFSPLLLLNNHSQAKNGSRRKTGWKPRACLVPDLEHPEHSFDQPGSSIASGHPPRSKALVKTIVLPHRRSWSWSPAHLVLLLLDVGSPGVCLAASAAPPGASSSWSLLLQALLKKAAWVRSGPS